MIIIVECVVVGVVAVVYSVVSFVPGMVGCTVGHGVAGGEPLSV